ncbi:glycosyltransferase family A protein [Azospirillum sp. B506]|uniref:glycosyltransferase family 2 protein n=1 Tax=Azospirillum sp. B506 TaxID=137721 RepID=UPI00034727CD|nr:glycosyltransferase family A protein [Azospirillum sp. B506]
MIDHQTWDGNKELLDRPQTGRPDPKLMQVKDGPFHRVDTARKATGTELISCLMVTRNRFPLARLAVECFRRQTYEPRELIVIDDSHDDQLVRYLAKLGDSRIRVERAAVPAPTLGEARNRSLALATGPYACQWDDDDLYDPRRLECQMEALVASGAQACMLSNWIFWWVDQSWVGISGRRAWEGSILCEKTLLAYPALVRGEDTVATTRLERSARVVLLKMPRLYTYIVHGKNTYDSEHFKRTWNNCRPRWTGLPAANVLRALGESIAIDDYVEGVRRLRGQQEVDRGSVDATVSLTVGSARSAPQDVKVALDNDVPLPTAPVVAMIDGPIAPDAPDWPLMIESVLGSQPGIMIDLRLDADKFRPSCWDQLSLSGHVRAIWVQLSATCAETYNRVRPAGDFSRTLALLEYCRSKRDVGEIGFFGIEFIVHALNFRDIPRMVVWGEALDLDLIRFRRPAERDELPAVAMDVVTPSHPDYPSLRLMIDAGCFAHSIVDADDLLASVHNGNLN